MLNTKDFKIKTITIDRKNPCKEGSFVLGVDIGYSAVKGMSPNKIFSFPAYAKKIPEGRTTLREPKDSDILYKDKNGTWAVGELAYAEVNPSDVIDSEEELFGRHRFYSPMFTVLTRTAYGVGLSENKFGSARNKKIYVQTGLPPKYEDQDAPTLKDVMHGQHEFSLKIGKNPWQKFNIYIHQTDIKVMSQPLGSFMSSCLDINGKPLPVAEEFYSKNVVVYDPGFGTMDVYTIKKGNVPFSETFPDLGMREIFARTVKDIKKTFNKEVQIPELQNYLEDGTIKIISRKEMRSKRYSFAKILEKNLKDVAEENIQKMVNLYNYFEDIDIIIVTGGLGDCWYKYISERLAGFEDLKIISANTNDTTLSNVFSNVRGYYYFMCNQCQ